MAFQSDGNLVLYQNGAAFWDSHTSGHSGDVLVLSPTAPFFTIRQSSGKVRWVATAKMDWLVPALVFTINGMETGSQDQSQKDLMTLLSDNSNWATARSHVSVFELPAQVFASSQYTDDQLRAMFSYLKNNNIAFAIAEGPLEIGSNNCGNGVEGYEGYHNAQVISQRIAAVGGQVDYIDMDEPFGNNLGSGCHQSMADAAANAAGTYNIYQAVFPSILMGDTENIADNSAGAAGWMQNYQTFIVALQNDMGAPVPFFHHDVGWDDAQWASFVPTFRTMLTGIGIPYGIIRDASEQNIISDGSWIASAENNIRKFDATGMAAPTENLFDSWDNYPTLVSDETGFTLTRLIDYYYANGNNFGFNSAASNNVLTGWDIDHVLANDVNSCYSSNGFPTANAGATAPSAAMWFPQPTIINYLSMQSRMGGPNGGPQVFPLNYDVYVTAEDNSSWVFVGNYSNQPGSNGQVVIDLNGNHYTYGVMVVAKTLGADYYGGHYFQFCGTFGAQLPAAH